MNKGTLYLVPTPIGNLKDITKRSKEVFNLVDYVACEDTRNTSKLLNLLGIKKFTYSCHEHIENKASEKIIADLLEGKNVAYCSDAGLPCISDPGTLLVKHAIENNISVVPLPGSNAALTALIASGLDTSNFYFYGFLDSKISKKEAELEGLLNISSTIIFYESPHRILETLESLLKILGNRKVCVARELTKIHEEFLRFELKDYLTYKDRFIGEMVIIVEGNKEKEDKLTDEEINKKVDELIAQGLSLKDSITAVSIFYKINKNYIKKLKMKN